MISVGGCVADREQCQARLNCWGKATIFKQDSCRVWNIAHISASLTHASNASALCQYVSLEVGVKAAGVLCFHIDSFCGRGRVPPWFKLTWTSAIPACGKLFLIAHLALADLWYEHYCGHEIKWSSELMLLEILSFLWEAFSRQINSIYCKAILKFVP